MGIFFFRKSLEEIQGALKSVKNNSFFISTLASRPRGFTAGEINTGTHPHR
jgi:hypothetical protein